MFKILIVDDDPTIRRLLERTLKKQGYDLYVAEDGRAGFETACREQPALIICDWMMPRMDGIEVCRRVRGQASLSTTFFILLTSLGSVEDRVRGLDAGADDFLSKPIEMNELKARVRAGLRLYQLNHDLDQQKRLLEAELAEAAEYVQTLLPADVVLPLPPAPEPRVEAVDALHQAAIAPPVTMTSQFVPSRKLGGDCFDFFWLDDERVVLYLVDAAGHGLKAALPSLSVLNLLRSRALPGLDYASPRAVLTALNHTFPMSDRNDKYFTVWYGCYNPHARSLTYASAGHPPALLLPAGGSPHGDIQRLRTPGLPVGMFEEAEYTNATCHLAPDSILYLFSDGLYEIEDSTGDLWGIDCLVGLLDEYERDGGGPAATVIDRLYQVHQRDHFEDDLSLVRAQFH